MTRQRELDKRTRLDGAVEGIFGYKTKNFWMRLAVAVKGTKGKC